MNSMISSRILSLALFGGIILGTGFFAHELSAQSPQGVTISPLSFELSANPGDELSNTWRVTNPTDDVISVQVTFEDFSAQGERGQAIVSPSEEETYSLKRWAVADPESFTLLPGERRFVHFTIRVPENAEPGGKYGAILATPTGRLSDGEPGAAVTQQAGALLLLSVAGDVREELVVEGFEAPSFLEYGPVPFIIRFENTGTVHVRPRGFVSISDFRGQKVKDVEFPQLNVLPNTVRRIEASWDDDLLFGRYTATLVGSYGASNKPFSPPVVIFWVIPWKLLVGIGVALLLIGIFFAKTRKRWQLAFRILVKGKEEV